jgi:hypothetical protein
MTQEQFIEEALNSMAPMKSTTRVNGWTIKVENNHYVILQFWMNPIGNHVGIYTAEKKGKKTSNTPIVLLTNCTDPVAGIKALAEKLITEETLN